MNKAFSFHRYRRLLSQELSLSINKIAVFAAVLVGTGIVLAYMSNAAFIAGGLLLIFTWLTIFAPFRLYPFLFDKIKGTQWSMQAASSSEKFASLFTQVVIIYPLALFTITVLSYAIAILIQSAFQWDQMHLAFEMLSSPLKIFRLFLSTWSIQSVAIFCVVHFKPNKIQKSILWGLLIMLSISLLTSGAIYIAKGNPAIQSLFETLFSFIDRADYYIMAIWTLFFWIISFLRMSKHQF